LPPEWEGRRAGSEFRGLFPKIGCVGDAENGETDATFTSGVLTATVFPTIEKFRFVNRRRFYGFG
jgi:hypothetical protein